MTNLIRWQPMRDFLTIREAMDQLFNEMATSQLGRPEGFGYPAVDMYQTENDVIIKATLPGIKAEDMQISVTGDVLTLRGEVRGEEETKNSSYHIRERRFGSFSRSIPLPAPVLADKSKAEFEDGVLTLVLPKAEEVRPKTITVKAK